MAPVLEQYATSSVAKYERRDGKVTFENPSKPGSLLILVVVAAGGMPVGEIPPIPNFTLVSSRGLRDIQLHVWMSENAPSITSVDICLWGKTYRSMQIRLLEYTGVAHSLSLDKLIHGEGESDLPRTGSTGNISQSEELILAISTNQYPSTTQTGFLGGFTRLFENTTPQHYGSSGTNEDWERSRVTIHHQVSNAIKSFSFSHRLSSYRRWLILLLCFRSGTTGPKYLTSTSTLKGVTDCVDKASGGGAQLSAFGPLASLSTDINMSSNPEGSGSGGIARIAPFNYQYRINGWNGLLIGSGTEYKVEGTEGLGGWNVRTSDAPIPRGDGSIRGVDLESARQFTLTINVGRNADQIELLLDRLYRSVIPSKEDDWPFIWRHPTQIPRMMMVRPIDLPRVRNSFTNRSYAKQTIQFMAVDPKHYSANPVHVIIPNTPAPALVPTTVQVTNLGNVDAYPLITIVGPTSGPPVTSVNIINHSTLSTFTINLTLPTGSTLLADMVARVTGARKSIITLDGQTRYGSWQLPREPFPISPDPIGQNGYNLISMETVPIGAPVYCTLDYRHTWSG